jgi:hypothetical protein
MTRNQNLTPVIDHQAKRENEGDKMTLAWQGMTTCSHPGDGGQEDHERNLSDNFSTTVEIYSNVVVDPL